MKKLPKIPIMIFLITVAFLNISFISFSRHVLELKINCDSLYTKKGLSVLHQMNPHISGEKKNSVFIFQEEVNGKITQIFRDTISSKVQKIEFADYNNDKVKDILVQNSSDVRSNWTYYLYLVNPKTFTLTKVEGFEEIKAPTYNAKYNLVTNYVMSGKNWTSFHKIIKNKIHDFNIVIYDGENEKGINTYEKDYLKAIKKITAEK
jgi:hypothetical protein